MFGHPVAAQLLRERPTLARIIRRSIPFLHPSGRFVQLLRFRHFTRPRPARFVRLRSGQAGHMRTTSQLIACLIAVPSVASLAVGPRAPNVKASMGSTTPAMCTRLESQQQAHAAAPFQEGRCAQPRTRTAAVRPQLSPRARTRPHAASRPRVHQHPRPVRRRLCRR